MKPLALLSNEQLGSLEVLASDIDDTLTHHGQLVPEAVQALHALARAGVTVVLATGRPVGWAELLVRLLPVRAVLAENGGAWFVREANTLQPSFAHSVRERTEGMERVHSVVAALREKYPALHPVQELAVRCTDVALDVGERVQLEPSLVQDALEFVRSRGLYAVASTVHLHVSAWEPDKFVGLCSIARALGSDENSVRSRWLYVGDSPNDEGAFRSIATSVGVANVRRFEGRMQHWPQYVTEQEHGLGFFELASRLLDARQQGAL